MVTKYTAANLLASYEDEGVVFLKSLDTLEICKGRQGEPLGTKKTWGGKEYLKTASGWKPVGKNGGAAKAAHDYVHGDAESKHKFILENGAEWDVRFDHNNEKHKNVVFSKKDHELLSQVHRKFEREVDAADLKGYHAGRANWHAEQAKETSSLEETNKPTTLDDFKKKFASAKSKAELDAMYKEHSTETGMLPVREMQELDEYVDELEFKLKKGEDTPSFQKSAAERILSCYGNIEKGINYKDAVDKMKQQRDPEGIEKAGEGSKGGKVIGHTKSGKPIYESHHDSHNDFTAEDHFDAKTVHGRLGQSASGNVSKQKENKMQHHRDMAEHHNKEITKTHWKNDISYYKNAKPEEQKILREKISNFDEERKKYYLDAIEGK